MKPNRRGKRGKLASPRTSSPGASRSQDGRSDFTDATTGALLKPETAAAILGVSVEDVRRAVRERRLTSYRIGREGRIGSDLSGYHKPPPPRPLPPPRVVPPKTGFVYWIGPEDDDLPVKVGWSVRPEGRLPSIQTGCWLPLVVLGAVEGTPLDERALHEELAPYRLVGEWFERIPAFDALVDFRAGLALGTR